MEQLQLWGVDGVVVRTDAPCRAVLDRLPASAQSADGWNAQAGMLSEHTKALVIELDTLDFGELGHYFISDIEHDGYGWSVLELGYAERVIPVRVRAHPNGSPIAYASGAYLGAYQH